MHLACSEEEAKESAKKFESEDIGDILAQRTSKRIMRGGGKAGGGTFSVANFKADDGSNGVCFPWIGLHSVEIDPCCEAKMSPRVLFSLWAPVQRMC